MQASGDGQSRRRLHSHSLVLARASRLGSVASRVPSGRRRVRARHFGAFRSSSAGETRRCPASTRCGRSRRLRRSAAASRRLAVRPYPSRSRPTWPTLASGCCRRQSSLAWRAPSCRRRSGCRLRFSPTSTAFSLRACTDACGCGFFTALVVAHMLCAVSSRPIHHTPVNPLSRPRARTILPPNSYFLTACVSASARQSRA
mmetsp:Transcript_35574/g.106340  ORF Transcript_35574/g.106340 Transcript_35574/m.106340 type:complete len:201 (+) Transcript_35574:173-775(+)